MLLENGKHPLGIGQEPVMHSGPWAMEVRIKDGEWS